MSYNVADNPAYPGVYYNCNYDYSNWVNSANGISSPPYNAPPVNCVYNWNYPLGYNPPTDYVYSEDSADDSTVDDLIVEPCTVFGSKLVDLCKKEKSLVPKFVKDCIATIERRGLEQDGLYRVGGNIAEIQKLRINIDNMSTNYHYNLDDECWDIHTLTGTLKLFFRELKEPLFPFNKFDKFLEIAKSESKMKVEDRLRNYKELIHSFPKCHRETLKELLQHLRKVISHSQQNRMQAQNIAIVFGPTLMWPEIEAPNLAISMAYQNRIVEFLLLEYENIF